MTKEVVLNRYYKDNQVTLGALTVGEGLLFYTLEKPWLNNARLLSCIPVGSYKVVPYKSLKFGDVWEITDVPERSAILIHEGNIAKDVKGCIAVGLSTGFIYDNDMKYRAVLNSKDAIVQLKTALNYPEEFTLIIKE